jgi:hypothetical protein
MAPALVAAADVVVLLLAALLERLIENREPHKMPQDFTQQRSVVESGHAQQWRESGQRKLAFARVKERQEQRKDVVGVVRGLNSESSAVRNRVGHEVALEPTAMSREENPLARVGRLPGNQHNVVEKGGAAELVQFGGQPLAQMARHRNVAERQK